MVKNKKLISNVLLYAGLATVVLTHLTSFGMVLLPENPTHPYMNLAAAGSIIASQVVKVMR